MNKLWMAICVSVALNGMCQNNSLYESFSIESSDCNLLTTSSGTTFLVPENAFTCTKGLTVKFAEISSPSEMIMAGVTMNSAEGMLESSGMFEIRAECGNQSIELNEGAEIEVNLVQTEVSTTDGLDQYFLPADQMNHEAVWETYESGVNVFNNDQSDKWGGLGQEDLRYYIPFEEEEGWEDDSDWSEDELSMGMQEVDSATYAQYLKDEAARLQREAAREKAFQSMKIDRMGWFNCDRLIPEEVEAITVKVYADKKKYSEQVIVVYEGLNSAMSFYPNKKGELIISLIKERIPKIFLINGEGEVYLSQEELVTSVGAKWYFESINQQAGSAEALSKAVGIR